MGLGLLGVAVIVLGLLVSIALHEFGHYLPARRFGATVPEFAVGFGPAVASFHAKGTRWVFRALPLGGYVRILGMFPPGSGKAPRGRLSRLAHEVREASAREVSGDVRPFYSLPWWQRAIVMAGGPAVNLAIWASLSLVIVAALGLPGFTSTVTEVTPCVPKPAASGYECPAGADASPAQLAGIQAGDVLVSVDGRSVSDWDDVREVMGTATPGTPVEVTVERAGGRIALSVTPAASPFIEGSGYLGVSPRPGLVRLDPAEVPGFYGEQVTAALSGLASYPERLVGTAQDTLAGRERDPNDPVGVVGVGRVGAQVAEAEVLPGEVRAVQLLGMIAGLNLFLFVFNMLPILPLDGGHVAASLFEGARRAVARLRRRPDPGPVDLAVLVPVSYAFGAVMILSSLVLLWADLVNPIDLFG